MSYLEDVRFKRTDYLWSRMLLRKNSDYFLIQNKPPVFLRKQCAFSIAQEFNFLCYLAERRHQISILIFVFTVLFSEGEASESW